MRHGVVVLVAAEIDVSVLLDCSAGLSLQRIFSSGMAWQAMDAVPASLSHGSVPLVYRGAAACGSDYGM